MYNFSDAVFTYFISKQINPVFECHMDLFNTGLIINYTKKTDVCLKSYNNKSICIIGICVDSHGEIERENVPEYLLKSGDGISEILTASKRLAGKFAVVVLLNDGMYVFNDATGTLQVYYMTDDNLCISSCSEIIGNYLNLFPSAEATDIIKNVNKFHTLPYDLTYFNNMKLLIPNHYLSVYDRKTTRYFPCKKIQKSDKKDVYEIVKRQIELSENIIKEYGKYYNFACALSSGWDSRTDLAFLCNYDKTIPCYTFKLNNFNDKTDDFNIPPVLCDTVKMKHYSINVTEPSEEYLKEFKEKCGKYHVNSTINLGYSFKNRFTDRALIEGHVIDPIATSHIGYTLPVFFANVNFFMTKLHNYSKHTRVHIKRYLSDVKKELSFSEIYDLFAMETRDGQWRATAETTYSLIGANSLNLFNCREIVEGYFKIPKTLRTNKIVHRIIMRELCPELMNYPFNSSDKFGWMTKHAVTFLFATYGKYIIGYFRNKRNRKTN